MAGGELSEELSGGGGRGNSEIVEERARTMLVSKRIEIRQVRSSDEEIMNEAHDEIDNGDPPAALFHGDSFQSSEDTEFIRQICDELEAGK